MTDPKPVRIDYFSDVLCVWAYLTQVRIDEVVAHFGSAVEIAHRACSVFGDTARKIGEGWRQRGGYEGFNAHLLEIAARFDHIHIHPDVWLSVRPPTSESAHLAIAAAGLWERDAAPRLAWRVRRAFFEECRDVARRDVQCALAEEVGIPPAEISARIGSGEAFAALAADHQERDRLRVEGSPTFVLNEGRQKLYGNVGYRVIEANVQELLRAPEGEAASWC
jgi:predicted DsbA family dithiol-disulfide isomerase